ncbi:MAG: hypothetical protein IJJ59_04455 [Pseudobutyrivibrio sp.]|uniref:hypothetical protein n=1 Tax=Pseudobutyrivibrio sp. TaxID=2014367 RepID=UPI0025CFB639|nr:hypothetical protein [Pseudobutyrivibrio sp.]MBQ6462554.1 hypothetical protein [Pseudobutyrivibrio sp.]
MMRQLNDEKRMETKYENLGNNSYSHCFFRDLTSGYKYDFGEDEDGRNFLSIEPTDCLLRKLLINSDRHYSSYELEELIRRIAYSLMVYGEAFVFITPEYLEEDGKQIMHSIRLGETVGFVKKSRRDSVVFCYKNFSGGIGYKTVNSNQLVAFYLSELGYDKRYFRKISQKLSQLDMIKTPVNMMTNPDIGYDFLLHRKKNRLKELKIAKNIGWSMGKEGLSDSYFLYNKIKVDKLKLQFLNYILEKLNDGLNTFFQSDKGKIVAHVKYRDYDRLWEDYSTGNISTSQLTKELYN